MTLTLAQIRELMDQAPESQDFVLLSKHVTERLLADDEEVIRNYLANRPEAYDRLTLRQKQVLKGRADEGLKLSELAARLGVTRERVRQIEAKTFRLLRSWASKDVGRCPHCKGEGYLANAEPVSAEELA